MLSYNLNMLLYSTFESVSAIRSCLPALRLFMLTWIHPSPDKCMGSPCTRKKNLLSHPGPFPSAPAGSTGSNCRRRRQLRIIVAACLPPQRRPQALEQPSGAIRLKDSLRQATLGTRKLVVSLLELARHVLVDYLVRNLVELFLASVVS